MEKMRLEHPWNVISVYFSVHTLPLFNNAHRQLYFSLSTTYKKFRFYTHPLFTYHPPFFHYLFSNFADEWAYTPKRTKKRERRCAKQTTARNKQTI